MDIAGSGLLVNLAIALLAALIGASVALRLGQSTMVGYIVAGIAIGPFTPGSVGDIEVVRELADTCCWLWPADATCFPPATWPVAMVASARTRSGRCKRRSCGVP